jgi:hypothetical protein
MQHSRRWNVAVLLLVAALALGVSACREQAAEEEAGASDAVKVEPVEGTDLSRVILSQEAAERLGIETENVREEKVAATAGGGKAVTRKVIPYAAVLYDEQGDTWTFTSPNPLTFLRQKISVDYIQGDSAVLAKGPAAGVAVVTVGSAELLGAELGVGEE